MPDEAKDGQFKPQMMDVSEMDISCADCGKKITELPFKPDPSRKIYCRDCYKNFKNKSSE